LKTEQEDCAIWQNFSGTIAKNQASSSSPIDKFFSHEHGF
jgi:hypothetical protein